MRIAITGASGQLGRLTAEAVLETADPSDLVLLTRTPDALDDFAAAGAEIRACDFGEPDSLTGAFAGIERLLLISTDAVGARVAQQCAAIDAAAAAGVRFIAYTSYVNPSPSNPAVVAGEHRATEDHLRTSGVAWTFLRNGVYAEVLGRSAPGAIATGRLLTNAGDGRVAYVARADCAAVAAAVLAGDGHDGRIYDITGSDALSPHDLAALYTDVSGTPVAVVALDDEAWIAAMVEHAGLPEPVARLSSTFGAGTRQGYNAVTSTAVEELTGRPPTPVRDVVARILAQRV